VFKANAMNEVDAGRDRATSAALRHQDDEPICQPFLCILPRAARPAHLLSCQTSTDDVTFMMML
jgi:hypothetical protein